MSIRDLGIQTVRRRAFTGPFPAIGLGLVLLVCVVPTFSEQVQRTLAQGDGVAIAASPLPKTSEERGREARRRMIESQLIARGIEDPRVLAAMAKVPRDEFVSQRLRKRAYEDRPLPIGESQTISQPYIVALMTELAKLGKESRVLEIGTGSGYQAAILGEVAGEVYSIEIIEELARSARETLLRLGYSDIHLRQGDGYQGWPEAAPFDAILVTAAPPAVPEPLKEQLAMGGRLVVPVGRGVQELLVFTKTPDGIERDSIIPVIFVPMTGEAQKREKSGR